MNEGKRGRKVSIRSPVMCKNDAIAAGNRRLFADSGIFAINVISSPGSGKTTLLERMAEILGDEMAVIEGDVQTRRDAERVEKTGCRVYQIETGGACHLDAARVAEALAQLRPGDTGCRILVIENVGNLVCPSGYDLGEHIKVGVLSLPEGDDKVLKYPSVFSRVGAFVINKIDLAAVMDFDEARAIRECASLNEDFETFRVSAKTGEGVDAFCRFLRERASALTA